MTIFRVPSLPKDTPSGLAASLSNAFKQIYADLKAVTANPGTVAIQTASYAPVAGEVVRAQPPAAGMGLILPTPSPDNRGDKSAIVVLLENPQGNLRVVVSPGSNPSGITPTIDGQSSATYSTAGALRFVSNGVNAWCVIGGGPSPTTLAGSGLSASGNTLNVNVGASLAISSDNVVRAALTGDVTASQDSNTTAIASNAVVTAKIADANVTNAKLANVTSDTFKGNVSGSTGAPTDVSLSSLAGPGITFVSHQFTATPGQIARLDASLTPIYLFDFNSRITDLSGNGLNLSVGTPAYAHLWGNMVGLMSGLLSRPSHDAAGTITGASSIEGIFVIPPGQSLSTARVAQFSDPGATDETQANNILYSLGFSYTPSSGASSMNWLSEHSTGVNDSFTSTGTSLQLPMPGVPFYAAGTRSSNIITLYLQGVQYGSASSALTTPDGGTTSVLNVNNNAAGGNIGILGLAIYNFALSSAQAKARYNATVGTFAGQI